MTAKSLAATLADKYCLETGDKIPVPPPKIDPPIDPPPGSVDLVSLDAALRPKALPPPANEHRQVRERWPRWKLDLFDHVRPHSVCIVSTDPNKIISCTVEDRSTGAVTRFGHNLGCRPIYAEASLSGSLKDTVTRRFNKNPFFFVGLQLRFWTPSERHARILAERVPDIILHMAGEYARQLENGFVDGGPDFDFTELELYVRAAAEKAKVPLWDDEGLSQYLDELGRQDLKKAKVKR